MNRDGPRPATLVTNIDAQIGLPPDHQWSNMLRSFNRTQRAYLMFDDTEGVGIWVSTGQKYDQSNMPALPPLRHRLSEQQILPYADALAHLRQLDFNNELHGIPPSHQHPNGSLETHLGRYQGYISFYDHERRCGYISCEAIFRYFRQDFYFTHNIQRNYQEGLRVWFDAYLYDGTLQALHVTGVMEEAPEHTPNSALNSQPATSTSVFLQPVQRLPAVPPTSESVTGNGQSDSSTAILEATHTSTTRTIERATGTNQPTISTNTVGMPSSGHSEIAFQ